MTWYDTYFALAAWQEFERVFPREARFYPQFPAEGRYMRHMIAVSTSSFSVSGLEQLDASRAWLFIGNHRDIALDPAFINFALYSRSRQTARVAIGDNLLTRDYVSDLMRLNKSFIVRRSEKGPRQVFAALQELSAYIRHSLREEKCPVWIAQMNSPQLQATIPAASQTLRRRGPRKSDTAAPNRPCTASSTPKKTKVQTVRCASTSSGGTIASAL